MGYLNLSNIVKTMFGKGDGLMPKLNNRYPKNCRDRSQAFSWYNGKRIYHGAWGSPEAEKNYKRFIAALLENPSMPLRMGGDSGGGVLVSELAAGYFDHIENSRMDKTTVNLFKQAIGYLAEVYGELAVNEFSPKKLKAVRSQMVKAATLCRNTVNRYSCNIVRIFQWGVEEELVQESVYNALRVVKSLPKGTPGTFDHPEREAVPDEVIAATLPFLPPTVAAMVQVQWLTGMRPSEVFKMRVGDIDRSRDNGLWYYSPKHKTEEHTGKKPIPLGKPEQILIAPYLEGKKPTDSVFSPKTAQRERAAEARANRKSKRTPSQRARDAQRAEENASRVGEFYDKGSYRNAVKYAIEKGNRHGVKIPHWTPYLLRNSAATHIELEHDLDAAQAQFGHTTADMTKRYSAAQLKQREKLAHSRCNPFQSDEEKAE
jgi:integrase